MSVLILCAHGCRMRAIPMRSTCWESSISAATACRRTRMLPTTGFKKHRRRDTTMRDFSWTASSGRSRRTFCSRQRGCSITWERSFKAVRPAPQNSGVQIDRKRLAKLRRMRMAAGHKADDHEQEQTNSTMSMGW